MNILTELAQQLWRYCLLVKIDGSTSLFYEITVKG